MTDCKNLDLARVFAEAVESRPSAYDEQVRAAADLISSLPDAWVDADKLRLLLDKWATNPFPTSDEVAVLNDVESLLPAPPAPRTLADMTEEERAECQWMQAEHEEHGRGIITHIFGKSALMLFSDGRYADPCYIGEIVPLSDLPRMEWPENEPDDVASATGGELTTQDVVDECRAVRKERAAAEFASPRPEDVPKGEFWIVESKRTGQQGAGVRNVLHPNIPWAVTFGAIRLGDNDISLIARLVPETTEQDDVPEFDPAYLYRDKDGDEWTHNGNGWVCNDSDQGFDAPPAEYGPYTRIEDTK